MTKYYVFPPNALGQRDVMPEYKGNPAHMDGVDIIELPANKGTVHVISRGRDYPDYKVALAIAAGQINIEDVR